MKNGFVKLYEELSQLNEAKQDTINFKNWLRSKGNSETTADNLTKRFDGIKSLLKSPENDYYYWIKNKNPEELADVINDTERVAEVKRTRKQEIAEGAKLVNESEHWKIYHITNFDASQYYGRDSRWCVTGVGSYGDRYWNDYTGKGYTFYFCITKQDYDPRGEDSKFAIALHKDAECYQVFDQQDIECSLDDIPYYEEIRIPGINLDYYENSEPRFCEDCGEYVSEDEVRWGADGEYYCNDCWSEHYFYCGDCGNMYSQDTVYSGLDGDDYCYDCWSDKFYECPRCNDIIWLDDAVYSELDDDTYCSDCWDEIQEENEEDEEE